MNAEFASTPPDPNVRTQGGECSEALSRTAATAPIAPGGPADPEGPNRRRVLGRLAALAGAPLVADMLASSAAAQTSPDDGLGDFALLNVVLSLEYLQFELFNSAINGAVDLGAAFRGANPGSVTGEGPVPDLSGEAAALVAEGADLEARHIMVLRAFMEGYGRRPVDRPALDLTASVTLLAPAGSRLARSPFAGTDALFTTLLLVEEVAVGVYAAIVQRAADPNVRTVMLQILAAEGYQGGALRTLMRQRGLSDAAAAVTRIVDTRGGLTEGGAVAETGLGDAAVANLVPADTSGFILPRRLSTALRVLYGGDAPGGFFPAGILIAPGGRRI
ncbi:dessication-related protein pcc13-62 precursor [Stappia sp. 22II-S9-Z10]|nr:dessication-related protein pcc13-62 precursor [Stappia sp. 22II-S9-Z10]